MCRVVITARNLVIPSVSQEGYDARLQLDNFPSNSSIITCDPKWMVSNPIGLIKNPGQDVYFSEEEDMPVAPKPKRISTNQKNVNSPGQVELDEYSDRWPQCCKEDYRSYALSKPQPYLTTKESAGVMYAQSCFHQHLLQN